MRARRRTLTAAAVGLLLLLQGGCRAFGEGSRRLADHRCALPADVAAAITSAALRDELRAEPVSPQSGAPARALPGGAFELAFTGDAAGRWLPRADHRLAVRWDAVTRAARVQQRALGAGELLPGFGASTTQAISVWIEPDDAGCIVRVDAPDAFAARVLPLVTRTLTLACGHERTAPGLTERNLATWRAAQLVRVGVEQRRDRPERTGELMWRAVRLAGSGGVVHRHLAELATAHGDERRALVEYRRALLLSDDPCQRAALAARAAAAALRWQQPTRLRGDAVDHLQSGDLAGAETLLHSARRRTPQPTVDYFLLSRVHRLRGDELGELAARLLSREHEPPQASPPATAPPAAAGGAWREQMRAWSRRLSQQLSPQVTPAGAPR